MKIVGVIGRAKRNIDGRQIFQVPEQTRRALMQFDNVVTIALLPTSEEFYSHLQDKNDDFSELDKAKLDAVLKWCDGFLAPGGCSWFHFDKYVIDHAMKYDKPFLGYCAGMQYLAGLHSEIEPRMDRIPGETHHNGVKRDSHTNFLIDGTKLKSIIQEDVIPVNSSHYYALNPPLNDDIVISAYSEDGVIEAVEIPDKKFIIGVQWHPEYLLDEHSKKLLQAFVDAL